MRRRTLLLVAAAICLGAAAAAAVLATDVGAWRSALRAGDAEAAADPSAATVPSADELLPFHAARDLLGLDDDLAFRRALVLFHDGYSGIPSHDQSSAGTEARAEAEATLERIVRSRGRRAEGVGGGEPARRARARRRVGRFEPGRLRRPRDRRAAERGPSSIPGTPTRRRTSSSHSVSRRRTARSAARATDRAAERRGGASQTTPGRGY